MKQKLRYLVCMLLMAVCSVTWGAETTATYVFTDREWNATLDGNAANWTCGSRAAGFTAEQGTQISNSASGANATSPVSFTNISKIVVTYCTNNKKGNGVVKVKVGSGTEQSFSVEAPSSGGGTTLKTEEFNYDSPETGFVTLTVDCTVNSIYIYSIAITYNPEGQTEPTDPDVSFLYEDITVLVGATGTNPISMPTGLSVASYSSDDEDIATVDADGTVHGVSAGTATITASWNATDNYNAGRKSFDVNVVSKITPDVSFASSTISLPVGGTATNAITKPEDLTGITFSTSDETIATVNATTGEVTAMATGTATITASWNATDKYNAGTTTYQLTVTESSMIVDFEQEESAYTEWTFTNIVTKQTNSNVEPHGDSYFGNTGGKTTASITTKSKIAHPQTLTCYVSKQSTNTYASTWTIQVSSDGDTWTDVASRSASDMTRGEWQEFSAELSAYSDVYVRVYYSGTTAIRCIDDLSLEVATAQQPYISLSTETLNTGDVYVGNEVTKTFTVSSGNLTGDISVATTLGTVNPTSIEKNGEETTVTWTYTPTEAGDFTGTITVGSEDDELQKTISISGNAIGAAIDLSVTEIDAGEVFVGNEVTKTFTVTGHNLTGDISVTTDLGTVSPTTIDKEAGETTVTWTYTPNEADDFIAEITVASSTDNLEETIIIFGSAVNAPEPLSLPFVETFDTNDGTGGNSGGWSGSVASKDIKSDNEGWTFENAKGADKCAKFGTGNAGGSAETPVLAFEAGKTYTLTFKAGSWANDETTLNLSITSGELSEDSFDLEDSEWDDYTVTITTTGPAAIKFFTTAGRDRFFLDEVNVTEVVTEYTVNIVDIGYATYVAEGNFMVGTDLEVYTAQDKGNEVDLTKVEAGTIVNAGTPVVLKGENGTYTLEAATEEGAELENNDLIAATEDVEGDGTIYVLNSMNGAVGFYRLSAGSVLEAGKAYLKSEDSNQSVKFFGQGDDTPTIISNVVRDNIITSDSVIYNMAGQRVAAPTKGISIINGKKYLLK